jgi:hypothetical protein
MKHVRFQDRNRLVTVLSEIKNRIDISKQEFECTWYSKSEFKNFRNDCVSQSNKVHQSEQWHALEESIALLNDDPTPLEGDEMDNSQLLLLLWSMTKYRGLEALRGKLMNRKIQGRQLLWKVVLEAQGLLQNDTRADEKIRLISQSVTYRAQKFARKMGIADALVSKNVNLQEMTLNQGHTKPLIEACIHTLKPYGIEKLLRSFAAWNQDAVLTSTGFN